MRFQSGEDAARVFTRASAVARRPPLAARGDVTVLADLRVVEASVMPTRVSGNTNAPVVMIAKEAADTIPPDAGSFLDLS